MYAVQQQYIDQIKDAIAESIIPYLSAHQVHDYPESIAEDGKPHLFEFDLLPDFHVKSYFTVIKAPYSEGNLDIIPIQPDEATHSIAASGHTLSVMAFLLQEGYLTFRGDNRQFSKTYKPSDIADMKILLDALKLKYPELIISDLHSTRYSRLNNYLVDIFPDYPSETTDFLKVLCLLRLNMTSGLVVTT